MQPVIYPGQRGCVRAFEFPFTPRTGPPHPRHLNGYSEMGRSGQERTRTLEREDASAVGLARASTSAEVRELNRGAGMRAVDIYNADLIPRWSGR